ncbi:D-alanyl-D-alanine endopeptidase [Tepidiphilus margaritifer]|uniref:D-alanyl-D-alanine endopeptidase n=1 Tax=Tepidiphilus margaritifer TaxID=203471 RepID=UPI000417FA93|nr:D-alanyl-D-alanine endopeptidase [Tepidiphilus margaritifer]
MLRRFVQGGIFALLFVVVSWAQAAEPPLKSESFLVADARSLDRIALRGDPAEPMPIASITKLMTAMVVLESRLPLDETITVGPEDVDTLKGSSSRLPVGTRLTRREALLLALMASENRAAMALSRHYPGGRPAFLQAMNVKARMLGMRNSHFVDPAGLNPANVASMQDLVKMVRAASEYPLIRDFSTREKAEVQIGRRLVQFGTTNRLVKRDDWHITLQKTGYTSEAGRCLVMLTEVSGRPVIMVLMNSQGKLTRVADAQRLRRWLETGGSVTEARSGKTRLAARRG